MGVWISRLVFRGKPLLLLGGLNISSTPQEYFSPEDVSHAKHLSRTGAFIQVRAPAGSRGEERLRKERPIVQPVQPMRDKRLVRSRSNNVFPADTFRRLNDKLASGSFFSFFFPLTRLYD